MVGHEILRRHDGENYANETRFPFTFEPASLLLDLPEVDECCVGGGDIASPTPFLRLFVFSRFMRDRSAFNASLTRFYE